jgi:predicted secreted protein
VRLRRHTVVAAALLLAAGPVAAQEGGPASVDALLGPLLAERQHQTVLDLDETARREVPQDELSATLVGRAEAQDAAAAQAQVNRTMTGALDAARKVTGVRAVTGGYSAGREERQGRAPVWAAEQALELTGGDGQALLGLVGELQKAGLAVEELRWGLAAATRRGIERQLLGEALDGLAAKARTAADGLGLKLVGWRRVSLVPVSPPFEPLRGRVAMAPAAEAPLPVAAVGRSEVTVTVRAEALLGPAR